MWIKSRGFLIFFFKMYYRLENNSSDNAFLYISARCYHQSYCWCYCSWTRKQDRKIYFMNSDDTTAFHPNSVKILWTNDASAFFINGKPTFINAPRSLSRNLPNSIILDSWVFDNFTSTDELFENPFEELKLFHQLIVKYMENQVANFNLFGCEFDNFTFKLWYWVILY